MTAAALAPLLASQINVPQTSWLPVLVLLIIAIGFAVGNLIISVLLVGPKRTGPGKETPYESGMVPVGDAHKRFNVRFYVVAMIFLVFDVEIVFLYPWAALFPHEVVKQTALAPVMLVSMGVFILILLVAYFYAWGKGVFRWD
jgi:NADH-quinone oxidoreductase subunit A